MHLIKTYCFFMLISVIFPREISEENEKIDKIINNRNESKDSKALASPSLDDSRWIPHYENNEQPVKRRRIRKRKRRPPVFEEDASITTRPQRLDEIREEHWGDLEEEMNQNVHKRRRIYGQRERISESKNFEKLRDPFTALQEEEEKQKKKHNNTFDLKTILKQSGGLSLSELLQQRNLTLTELLKGNRQAISALIEEAETTNKIPTSTETIKYRRLPPSIGLRRDENKSNNRNSPESLSLQEVLEAQRKRLAVLHSHRQTSVFPDVSKIQQTTETITKSNDKTTEPVSFTTQTKIFNEGKVTATSANMNTVITQAENEVSSEVPENVVFINLTNTTGTDGPLKMVIDLSEDTINDNLDSRNVTSFSKVFQEVTTITTTAATPPKLKHFTPEEEIMEILKDPKEKEKLSRILGTRNMTIEELIELRERGSSHLYLADIFHNKTKEPEPLDEPLIGTIKSNNLPSVYSNRIPKTIKPNPEAFTSIRKEVSTTKFPYTITHFPTYKIETKKQNVAFPVLPLWQQLYPHFYDNDYDNNLIEQPQTTRPIINNKHQDSEELEDALADAAHSHLKTESLKNTYDDEELINIPSGVKSAVLASLVIIGLSLLVFLTILIIFKVSQRQRRLTYSGSVIGSRIKSPILDYNHRRNFRTFVSETLGKRKNYYKTHLRSMSDSIWKNDEKKYMI